MKKQELYNWLFENGGPVIRYRTAIELLPKKAININILQKEMLKSPIVKQWLDRMNYNEYLKKWPETQKEKNYIGNEIHGIKETAIENIFGKLVNFGIKRGIPDFDNRVLPFYNFLKNNKQESISGPYGLIQLPAVFLALAGFTDEPVIDKYIKTRINEVYDFVKNSDYDIYEKPEKLIRDRPVMKLNIHINLPHIYDLIGWAPFISTLKKSDKGKIDIIINYIFNKKYQDLAFGYGMAQIEKGKYFADGWSIQLPGHTEYNKRTIHIKYYIVWVINLLINFKAARQHQWFKEMIIHLEEFKTGKGTYLFPKEFLQEKPKAYWVMGMHMALDQNTRSEKVLELESTFWMCRFKKIMEEDK